MTLSFSKTQLQKLDLLNGAVTAPGRPRRYLAGGKGLLPHSCTLFVYKDLPDCLAFTVRSLKTGSGVKCVFDQQFSLPSYEPGSRGMVEVKLHPDHVDAAEFAKLDRPAPGPVASGWAEIVVQDSMETESGLAGNYGIIDSWRFAYEKALQGQCVLVNLTNLRPAGSSKEDGYNVTSSGPASFAKIYLAINDYVERPTMLNLLKLQGTLNEVVLKGGHKRGIVTSMMHSDNLLITEYLDAPTAELAGSHKKGVILSKAVATKKEHANLRKRICDLVNSESIFLQKDAADLGPNYANTFSNVCVGIMLPDRGTCLIWRVNLGKIATKTELIDAFVDATLQCVSLHKIWHDEQTHQQRKLWAPLEQDCQVAIDVLGLANMLALHGYTYEKFMDELRYFLANPVTNSLNDNNNNLASWFAEAYQASTIAAQELADELGLPTFLRLHTVEPAQAHAFEVTDNDGGTSCRGIWPPFDQIVNRISDSETTITVDHGEVETIADLGAAKLLELNILWQQLMNDYGLPHAISMDIYSYVDEKWLADWLASPLLTAYYQFAGVVDQSYARKTVEDIEIPDRERDEAVDNFLNSLGTVSKAGPTDSEPTTACPLDPTQRAECSVCAE